MKIREEDIPEITNYLTKVLPKLSNAKPDVLAMYIIAQLKKDYTFEKHNRQIVENLKMFIKEPDDFVAELLRKVMKRRREEPPKETKPFQEEKIEHPLEPTTKKIKTLNGGADVPMSKPSKTVNQKKEGIAKPPRLISTSIPPEKERNIPVNRINENNYGRRDQRNRRENPRYDVKNRSGNFYPNSNRRVHFNYNQPLNTNISVPNPMYQDIYTVPTRNQGIQQIPVAQVPFGRKRQQPFGQGKYQNRRQRKERYPTKTLEVYNIPHEKNDKDKLFEFFARFGPIENILTNPDKKKAFVGFAELNDAIKAFSSRDAILEDRFIRCNYYVGKSMIMSQPTLKQEDENQAPPPKKTKKKETKKDVQNTILMSKKKMEMIQTLLESYREITSKISTLSDDSAEKKILLQKSKEVMELIERLQKEQMEELEKSKNWVKENKKKELPKQFTLDNRPTTLSVKNWPADELTKEAIKNHFKYYGYIVFIEIQEGGNFLIKFAKRKAAEKAKNNVKKYHENNLTVDWYTQKINFEENSTKKEEKPPLEKSGDE